MFLRLATRAMGTGFELVLVGEDEPRLRAAGEEAIFEIEECDRRLSLFRNDSLLSHLNRSGAGRWVRVDAEAYGLFRVCDELFHASGGAFDPTVAPLMRALGFHGEPGDAEAARELVGWDGVELDDSHRAIRFRARGLTIDFGAIGKGHGLDLAARVLREAGVESAILHGGTSTVVALGPPPGEAGWRVALSAAPDAPVATLVHRALSVSTPEGRTVVTDDGESTHVLDPRTGRSAASGVVRAAVLAESATLADAWSTALLVAGDRLPVHDGVETLHATGEPPRWRHRQPRDVTYPAETPA